MPAKPITCVYCRAEPASEIYQPFCSDRCKMADLGRWLQGDYAVPAVGTRDIEDTENDPDPDLEIDEDHL